MTIDHYAEANACIKIACDSYGPDAYRDGLQRAQVHATLALVDAQRDLAKWVREVSDQLDTLPRRHKEVQS